MTWSGCEETSWWLTWALRQDHTRASVEAAFAEGLPLPAIFDRIVADIDPAVAMQVRYELSELPSAVTESILAAWRQASSAGKPFELASVRPASPLDLARRRSVRVAVDISEDGVRAELSHIGSRHPTWPEAAVSTAR
jgi:hypothetical protein